MSKEHVLSEMIPLFKNLAADEQDSVRLLTVDSLIAIAEVLTPEENKTQLLEILRSMCSDKSWRVRYMVADKFVQVGNCSGAHRHWP